MSDYISLSQIPVIYHSLRKTFQAAKTKPIAWRRKQLLQLCRFAKENVRAIEECLFLDLGKPKQEALMSEIASSIDCALHAAENVEKWARPEFVTTSQPWQQAWNPRVEKHPKGVVLIISPWNLPFFLTILPLCGAIAAGCCALIKPSEITHHTSFFLAENLLKYVDPDAFKVCLGGIPETTRILELRWDHISYTGNSRVARIISAAAAKHLTPLTLELGGKSPAIVDSTANISISAKRILWSKVGNAGQTCVAVDYVMVEKSILPDLIESLKDAYESFFPNNGGALKSESYARIVSDLHFERLKDLLRQTDGEILFGGDWDSGHGQRQLEPTIVVGIKPGDMLMQEEIFGPILPIMAVENVGEAIAYLSTRPDSPLVVYIFSGSEQNIKKIITNTTSGNVTINDTIMQTSVKELPFGGVGESGYGRVFGQHTFDNFVYRRSITDIPYLNEPSSLGRYPPYTKESYEAFAGMLDISNPEVGEALVLKCHL
ncbi:hypothetical protein CVT26_012060 [Gymnopilus dilepis]|uniref:Aldehyde dehydrogenase n=1 Tax=Gymnopilus dilepis TaxID=231916 RepID=A0A409W983_9AGAR|nr:hypothetical protein CVT26_012060 [Gymnopilus dilepis]